MGQKQAYIVRSNDATGIRFTNCRDILDDRWAFSEYLLPDRSHANLEWLRTHSFVWIEWLGGTRCLVLKAENLAKSSDYATVIPKLVDYPPSDRTAMWLNDANGRWQVHLMQPSEAGDQVGLAISYLVADKLRTRPRQRK